MPGDFIAKLLLCRKDWATLVTMKYISLYSLILPGNCQDTIIYTTPNFSYTPNNHRN